MHLTCSAFANHKTVAISAIQFSGKDKIKDLLLATGSVFVLTVNVLNFLPRYVVDDFWIDIVVNGIAVPYFSVVFGVGKNFVDLFIGNILALFCSYAASL